MIDYPIYYTDERRKYRADPERLKEIVLQYYPMTREFIDWVVEQGFKIEYFSNFKKGTGAIWWSLKRIAMSPHGEKDIIDLLLFHEITHLLIPGVPNPYEVWARARKYEESIDEIATVYLKDLDFVKYAKKIIPIV